MKLSLFTTRWLVIGLTSVVALGCDLGGGDDDNDSGGGEIIVLPTYAYELTSTADDPLTVVPPGLTGSQALRLSHVGDGPGIFGTYTVEDGTLTMEAGSSLVVEELAEPSELYGDFTIEATETWILMPEGPPTQGAFTIRTFFDLIYAEVTDDGALRLTYDFFSDGFIDDTRVLSWQELEELDDSDAPYWQKLAGFAIQIGGEFIPELMGYGIGGFDLIVPELENASPVTVSCDALSDLGLVPPEPGIPDAGLVTFTWLDDASDGDVGPGDSFETALDYCLVITPPVVDDQVMIDGVYGLNSYTEVVENNTLIRIGYEGTSPAGRPGGMVFNDFRQFEVYDPDGPGGSNTATVHLGATIDGRMTLVFFEPVN